jgi:3-hydroxyisobutyrate dehydrogenase
MGSSIAQRLMAVGHDVAVWNRDVAKTRPLTDAGARSFASVLAPTVIVFACQPGGDEVPVPLSLLR